MAGWNAPIDGGWRSRSALRSAESPRAADADVYGWVGKAQRTSWKGCSGSAGPA